MFKSANLCQQAMPPAPLHLENVLLNGPQKCPEATILIFDDLVEKKCVHYEGNYLCRKVDSWLFCVYLWIEMQNGRVRVILFTVARILLAVAGRGVSSF